VIQYKSIKNYHSEKRHKIGSEASTNQTHAKKQYRIKEGEIQRSGFYYSKSLLDNSSIRCE
jgi:hypothetical protein